MTRFIPTHEDLQAWLATRTIRGAAIDKALLESCIAEAAGDDAEMSTFLRERYAKNEALAARFVGGFTRTADYTQKTQALSAKEREFGAKSADLEKQLTAVRLWEGRRYNLCGSFMKYIIKEFLIYLHSFFLIP